MEGEVPPTIICPSEETKFKPFKLHVPNTRAALRRCSCQIIAFAVSFASIVCLSLCLLLILQLMIIGYWARIYHDLTQGMPKTFAWEILIRMFGSLYNDCTDRTGLQPIYLTVPDHCSNDFTMPSLPIVAMTLLICTTFSGVFCFIDGFLHKISTLALRSLWILAFLKFVLSMGAVISLSLSFSGNEGAKHRLQLRMSSEMEFATSPSDISPRWKLTQSTYGCCAMSHFTDWKFNSFKGEGNPRYPRSCCDHSKFNCKFYPNRTEVFQTGCLNVEQSRVQDIGMNAIYLLCVGLISTVMITMLLTLTRSIYQGDGTKKVTLCKRNVTPNSETLGFLGTLDPPSTSTHDPTDSHLGGGDQATMKIFSTANSHNHKNQNPYFADSYRNSNTWKLRRDTDTNVRLNGCVGCWDGGMLHLTSNTPSSAHAEILKKETSV